MPLKKHSMNNMNTIPVIFNNSNDLNLELKSDTKSNLIISDFLGKEIKLNVKDNSNASVLLFCKNENEIELNALLNENANLNLDVILMNKDTKINLNANLVKEYANLNVNVLSMAKDSTKEINFFVEHNAKETKSVVNNIGISFENGKNHFNVNGIIKPNMTNSEVRQLTRGLILGANGECLAKPILLIDHHDVKAYHGATIGKISDDDLFYLMSRGLTKDESFMLIINGLLEPFVKEIQAENIKEEILNTYQSYFVGE